VFSYVITKTIKYKNADKKYNLHIPEICAIIQITACGFDKRKSGCQRRTFLLGEKTESEDVLGEEMERST